MSIFLRKPQPPAPDPLDEAVDLGKYATTMFTHTVETLQQANAQLLQVEDAAQAQIEDLTSRQAVAFTVRQQNAKVIKWLEAVTAS